MAHPALEAVPIQDESEAMPRPESFPAALPTAPLHRDRRAGRPSRTRPDETENHAAKCRRAGHAYATAQLVLATLGRSCDPLG
jgi:hypothetical protein